MQSSKDLLSEVYSKIRIKGLIDEEFIKYLDSIFPDKSPNILEVIKRGITKYIFKPSNRIVWTAIGKNDEYMIYPKTYCSCIDFYKSVVIKGIRSVCKHLVAQLICEALNNFEEKEMEDIKFKDFIEGVKLEF